MAWIRHKVQGEGEVARHWRSVTHRLHEVLDAAFVALPDGRKKRGDAVHVGFLGECRGGGVGVSGP
jgi:hypothetical protein